MTDHWLKHFFISNFPSADKAVMAHITALQLCDSRRRKLPEECLIKAQQWRQRPARSCIPPTPAPGHSPCTRPTTTQHAMLFGTEVGTCLRICGFECVYVRGRPELSFQASLKIVSVELEEL